MQMEPSTRREMLGRLGGLLAGLAWFLVPGVLRATVRTVEPAKAPARPGLAVPLAQPPQNSVKRHG